MLRIIFGGVMLMLCASCKKVTFPPGGVALTVVNAVVGTELLSPNFKGTEPIIYSRGNKLTYGQFASYSNNFGLTSGTTSLAFYNYPDTLPKSTPLFLFNMDFPVGSMNTLFLTGTVAAPESLLLKEEKFPYHASADSVMAIRFVNLSKGSDPISVNLINQSNGSEVLALAYKEVTAFKPYEVRKAISTYIFECRNAATGVLIASYTATEINGSATGTGNAWIYRNFTLALIGTIGATGEDAPKLLRISHSNN